MYGNIDAANGFIIGVLIASLITIAIKLIYLIVQGICWFIPWLISEVRRYYVMYRRWDAKRIARKEAEAQSQVYYRINNEGRGPDRS